MRYVMMCKKMDMGIKYGKNSLFVYYYVHRYTNRLSLLPTVLRRKTRSYQSF